MIAPRFARHARHARFARYGAAALVLMASLPSAALAQAEWNKLPRMQLERQFAGPL